MHTFSNAIMPDSHAGFAVREHVRRLLLAIAVLAAPVILLAQTDEIQVYDAKIAEPGKLNLMIHMNFTPIGRTPRPIPVRSSPTIRSRPRPNAAMA